MWSHEIEAQVKEIYQWSYGYFMMYSKAKKDCESKLSKLSRSCKIANALTAVLSIIASAVYQNSIPVWVTCVTGILSVITGTIMEKYTSALSKNDMGTFDTLTSDNFSLFCNIRRQLQLPIPQRQPGEDYLVWIQKDYDRLNNGNILDQKYYDWYKPIADASNMLMPKVLHEGENFVVDVMNANATSVAGATSALPPTTSDSAAGATSAALASRVQSTPELVITDHASIRQELFRVKSDLPATVDHDRSHHYDPPSPRIESRPEPAKPLRREHSIKIKPNLMTPKMSPPPDLAMMERVLKQPRIAPKIIDIPQSRTSYNADISDHEKFTQISGGTSNSTGTDITTGSGSAAPMNADREKNKSITFMMMNPIITSTESPLTPKDKKVEKTVQSAVHRFMKNFDIPDDMDALQTSTKQLKRNKSVKNLFQDKYNDDRMAWEIRRQNNME